MLDIQSRAYKQQYGCDFRCVIPNNCYGPNDNFDLENGHVIPSLIRRIYEAKLNGLESVSIWGDGSALRQFTYSEDIAEILIFLLGKKWTGPINIGNTEEVSIKDLVNTLCKILDYGGQIVWDTSQPSGQHQKTLCTNKFRSEVPTYHHRFVGLENGLKKTCEWFVSNYPNVRGIS